MPIVSASVPASLPPSGTAGGDLGGTYPNPSVDLMAGGTITGPVVVDNASATTRALTVDAVGGSGAGLQVAQFRKADGTRLVEISETAGDYTGTRPQLYVDDSDVFVTVQNSGSGFFVGDPTGAQMFGVGATGGVSIQPQTGSANEPFIVRLQDGVTVALEVSQTGILWLPGSATGTSRIDASGRFVIGAHTVPADGDLYAGDCALWFDQTNGVGNTKLMVKGKSADGTVKTATVLLA